MILDDQIRRVVQQELRSAQHKTYPTQYHVHNGLDAPMIPASSIVGLSTGTGKTYGGTVDASATKGSYFPTGWSVTNITTGVCQVTHNLGTSSYVAVATCGDNNIDQFYLYNYNSTYFFVASNIGASPTNCDFSFIVQTP